MRKLKVKRKSSGQIRSFLLGVSMASVILISHYETLPEKTITEAEKIGYAVEYLTIDYSALDKKKPVIVPVRKPLALSKTIGTETKWR